jgi:protein SCO1
MVRASGAWRLCAGFRERDNQPPALGDTMPQPAAMARAAINALPRAVPRQCTRLMSTVRSAQAKRPTPPGPTKLQSQPYQPLVQRRFKFKTVEEAKSRYRSGVRIA